MGVIESRRSTRCFASREVSEDVVRSIIGAGLLAPSGKNRQPWRFVVSLQDKKRSQMVESARGEIGQLMQVYPSRNDLHMALETLEIMASAPVVVYVLYELDSDTICSDDADWRLAATNREALDIMAIGAAVENMLLKAEELGLGSLWCGDILYAYREFAAEMKNDAVLLSAICFGYKAREVNGNSSRRPLEQICEHI